MNYLKIACLILIAGGFNEAARDYGNGFFVEEAGAAPSVGGRQFLGSFQDWDAFTEKRGNNETACYTISVPKEKLPKKAKRREVYMIITNWPKAKMVNQVSVIMGYPLKKGSTVSFVVDKHAFKMFIDGDRAWAWDSKQDSEMTDALKNGSAVVIKGVSSRGSETTDRYSLAGFAAAHNAITKACN